MENLLTICGIDESHMNICEINGKSHFFINKKSHKFFRSARKPLKFRSDGGAQFDSKEMKNFLEDSCIQHGQSSPYNPQSNGHAKRNVAIVKHLIIKTGNDIHSPAYLDGITQIRNTPRADGVSPCQVVFGRSIRTLLP